MQMDHGYHYDICLESFCDLREVCLEVDMVVEEQQEWQEQQKWVEVDFGNC